MKKILLLLVALLLIGVMNQGSAVYAQTHQVTFILNTATVPDTLPVVGSNIQIRGGLVNSGTSPITWNDDPQNNMTHIGGDYWSTTLTLNTNDTLAYKYVVSYVGNTGWEQNTVSQYPGIQNTNRDYICGNSDTTLEVEFWNNGSGNNPQYFRPWTAAPDSMMSVYFRVNMSGPMSSGSFSYNNNTDTVAVRGGGPLGGDLNWAPSYYLTKESPASNGAGYTIPAATFWSGRLMIPKSGVTEGESISYKFLIGFDWGRDELQGQANRSFTVPVGLKDTTLQWVFYNNERPSAIVNQDTVVVNYYCDMAKALSSGGFTFGDTLYVQSGFFGTTTTPSRQITMENVISSLYNATDTLVTSIGKPLDYQYYSLKNGVQIRENYYNFTYNGPNVSEAEDRQFNVPNHAFDIYDTATSIIQARRQPDFPSARTLKRNVLVTWQVDMRPAIYEVGAGYALNAIQGGDTVRPADKDSILKWGVWINGPAVGGWSNPLGNDWGIDLADNPDKQMYDDGTHGDKVAGDSIFTRQVFYSPDSLSVPSKGQVGQVYKFGIKGSDNEGGQGGYGNNHSQNIVDNDSVYTIFTQFGSINPSFYSAWDYDHDRPAVPTGVKDPKNLPRVFALAQNYPNPFNPVTRIEYQVPKTAVVTIKVYNVLGQEVSTLVNSVKTAGYYQATFGGAQYSTGIYFYRMSAGSFVSTKKMVYLK